jgi:molybdopterin/thiamine biosynthesis adenylyltransferase
MNLKEGKVQHFGCYNQDLSLLQKRLPSLTPQTDTDQKVTIIGCGSAGSFIAEELVKSGVRNFVLIDDDYLTVENVFRHSCNLTDAGLKKIHALQRKLLKINPLVNIESIDTKIRVINAETEEKIKNSTLIINATANIEEVVNEFCWRYKIPSIYSIVYPEGFGGEVLRVLPGSTPCFECMNFHVGQMLKSMPGFEEFPNNTFIDYDKTIEGEIIATPALSADIKFVALFVVKFALDILRLKKEVLTDNSNVILWGNDKKWIFTQAHECLKIDTSNFQPLRNCVVCFGNEQIEREIGMNANEMQSMIDSIEITNGKN